MLSKPKNPPWNRLRSSASLRFTHQVKFVSRRSNTRARNSRSPSPRISASRSYTYSAAHAVTGGLTSLKFHSYAGTWPFGCRYRVLSNSSTCAFAKSTSTSDNGAQ